MISGTPRFNSLAIFEGSFNLMTPSTPILHVKAAFVNSTNGNTHGFTEMKQGWSKDTLRTLDELRVSMERDLAGFHLEGAESSVSDGSSPTGAPSGIGEHLSDDDAVPQV